MLTELGESRLAASRTCTLEDKLLYTGLLGGDFTHASGVTANNKLELGWPEMVKYFQIRSEAAYAIGRIVKEYKPDLLVPIPSGANGYAMDIAFSQNIDFLLLAKHDGWPTYRPDGEARVRRYERILMIEDVPNRFTSLRRVLDLPGMAKRTIGVAALWDRGDAIERGLLLESDGSDREIPVESVIRRYIPPVLPPDDPMWSRAHEDRRI